MSIFGPQLCHLKYLPKNKNTLLLKIRWSSTLNCREHFIAEARILVIQFERATWDEILAFLLFVNPVLSSRNAFALLHSVTKQHRDVKLVRRWKNNCDTHSMLNSAWPIRRHKRIPFAKLTSLTKSTRDSAPTVKSTDDLTNGVFKFNDPSSSHAALKWQYEFYHYDQKSSL